MHAMTLLLQNLETVRFRNICVIVFHIWSLDIFLASDVLKETTLGQRQHIYMFDVALRV